MLRIILDKYLYYTDNFETNKILIEINLYLYRTEGVEFKTDLYMVGWDIRLTLVNNFVAPNQFDPDHFELYTIRDQQEDDRESLIDHPFQKKVPKKTKNINIYKNS